jgi:hypothetical protein
LDSCWRRGACARLFGARVGLIARTAAQILSGVAGATIAAAPVVVIVTAAIVVAAAALIVIVAALAAAIVTAFVPASVVALSIGRRRYPGCGAQSGYRRNEGILHVEAPCVSLGHTLAMMTMGADG